VLRARPTAARHSAAVGTPRAQRGEWRAGSRRVTLRALLGDYPVTRQFKAQARGLEFADVPLPQTAFPRVVRELEFDVAELAIVTFLLARAHGVPLRLLPVVLTARFQHACLVRDAEREPLAPAQLEGRRVGLRSYSVTTATWLRGILADDHGVNLQKVRWVSFEEPHVAQYRDPPGVERAAQGAAPLELLRAGELDAAILSPPPADPRLCPVIPDPAAAAQAWQRRTGAVQINHMVCVRSSLGRALGEELTAQLGASRAAAGSPELCPFGLEANRRSLEVAIDCVYRQGMIPRRFAVEELFA
jgi:4,5-dihydroxyphthalate decarboxylase